MDFIYRKATENERDKYLDFANLVFSNAHEPHDFQALIPKVYGQGRKYAHIHNIAVRDDGSIRGLVAVMPNTLNIMGTELKTGYVGTVSVHPYARGEGHMKKLMAMAIEGMEAEGMDMAMLGGQRQRYEYFGFTKGGVAVDHNISATNVRHVLGDVDVSGIEITDVAENDAETIAKCCALHEACPVAAHRSAEEFHIIARTWYYGLKAVTIGGEFAGYIIARGDSIGEMRLYDYANALKVIKRYIQLANVKRVGMGTGAYEVALNAQLARIEENSGYGMPEMLRIFNFPKVIGALMALKAAHSDMADGEMAFVIDGKPMTIRVKAGVPSVTAEAGEDAVALTAMEAQRLFLGFDGQYIMKLPFGWANLPLYMSHIDAF